MPTRAALPELGADARALTARTAAPEQDRPAGSGRGRGAWPRLRHLGRPALIFLASRVLVMITVSLAAVTAHRPAAATYAPWDSSWYLLAARSGYARHLTTAGGQVISSAHAFFPLFPASVRAVVAVTGLSYVVAGVAASTAFGLAASVAVWLLARELWGAPAADRATACVCLFPASFVFTIPYAEGAMVAFGAGCLLALLRQRWLLAGLLGALATATRPNAVVLVACCAWAAAVAVRRQRAWPAVTAPLLAPLGFAGFMLYLRARTGRWDTWLTVEHDGWRERLDPAATWTKVSFFVRHPFTDVNNTLVILGIAFIVVAGAVLVRARPPGILLVYTVGTVALALASQTLGARPRFVLTAFPLVAVLGARLRPRALAPVLAVSAGLLCWLTVLTTTTVLATP